MVYSKPDLDKKRLRLTEGILDDSANLDDENKNGIPIEQIGEVLKWAQSLDRARQEVESSVFSSSRKQLLELALLFENGKFDASIEERIQQTRGMLAQIVEEIERTKWKDTEFNYPALDSVTKIVFENLPLLFSEETSVQHVLTVLQRAFRQRYNAAVVVDEQWKAIGLVPSAVLINSDPESSLAKIPSISENFSITLKTSAEEITDMLDRLWVNVLPIVDQKGIPIGIFTSRDHITGKTVLYSKQLLTMYQTQKELGGFHGFLENGERTNV